MEVFFYLPEKYLPSPERQAQWKSGRLTDLEPGGKTASAQAWIFQTWVELERSGFPARLTHEMPTAGIVVTLTGFLDPSWSARNGIFLAGIAADATPHPASSLHIVQNSVHARHLPNACFMPHWPQPGLRARDVARGDRFENVCFFGDEKNLAVELRDPAWLGRLKVQTGVTLSVRAAARWHDYGDVDCVVAIRSFGRGPQFRKPATKLYNAWLAGVPFIGGSDSAFRGDGHPGRNYLVAAKPDELIVQISRLRSDSSLRASLVEAGRARSASFSFSATAKRWTTLLGETIPALIAADSRRSGFHRSLRRFANLAAVEWDRRIRA